MTQILIEKMIWESHIDNYEDAGAKVINYTPENKNKIIQQLLVFITEDKDNNERINKKKEKLVKFFDSIDKNDTSAYVSFELSTDFLFTNVFDTDVPEEIRLLLSVFDIEKYQKKILKIYEEKFKKDLNAYKKAGDSILNLENSSYMSTDF